MLVATITENGQIVIPAEIRARYDLTLGTQLEFIDEGGTIRLARAAPGCPVRTGAGLWSGQT